MSCANLEMTFVENKRTFFRQSFGREGMEQVALVTRQAQEVPYSFLLKNHETLQDEFTHLYAVLRREGQQHDDEFWMYCYSCAILLESFYEGYSQQKKKNEYAELKEKIKSYLETRVLPDEQEKKAKKKAPENFRQSVQTSLSTGLSNLVNAPWHMSKIRDYVTYTNICRAYWTFCRLSITNGFALAKSLQVIDKLDSLLGTKIDVDKIISTLQAPNQVLNYLSVGLFLVRFLVDTTLLIKHVFFPTDEDRGNAALVHDRFLFELKKRHYRYLNDLTWAIVNLLSNFSKIMHVSNPVSMGLTIGALGFDICNLLLTCHLEKQKYLAKKAQYHQDHIQIMQDDSLTAEQKLKRTDVLYKVLMEQDLACQAVQAHLYFNVAAATLLMIGFSAAVLFSPPGIAVAGFFVGMLACAMYLSGDVYKVYQEKKLRLGHVRTQQQEDGVALKEYETARNDFIFTMAKNAIIPTLLISTFAICWPAAVILTVVYLGYELYRAHGQPKNTKPPEEMELADLGSSPPIVA